MNDLETTVVKEIFKLAIDGLMSWFDDQEIDEAERRQVLLQATRTLMRTRVAKDFAGKP